MRKLLFSLCLAILLSGCSAKAPLMQTDAVPTDDFLAMGIRTEEHIPSGWQTEVSRRQQELSPEQLQP